MRSKKFDKPSWLVYTKNAFAWIIFFHLKLFFGKKNQDGKSLLFVNTGQIGDLVLSSIIMCNDSLLTEDADTYFLLDHRYIDLYKYYEGKVKFISFHSFRYKVSVFYRYKILSYLHSLKLRTSINITTGRGPINDELTLLSGGHEAICLNNNSRYLKRIFTKYYDRQYSTIINLDVSNEFLKQAALLRKIVGKPIHEKTTVYFANELSKQHGFRSEDSLRSKSIKSILVFPFSDIVEKDWPIDNYRELIAMLSEHNNLHIVINGTKEQRRKVGKLIQNVSGKENVFNFAGKYSLLESARLVNECDLFIGNDSGFTHIAKALNKNIIAIIGGGYYGTFFPYKQNENEYLLYKDVDCKGCGWRCIHEKKICLVDVTPLQVCSLALKILA